MDFEPDKKAVGRRIRDIRIARNETMEDFAIEVKSNKSNVSRWERGVNLPNPITLDKIAELAGMSVDELVYGEKQQRPYQYSKERIKNTLEPLINHEMDDDALDPVIDTLNNVLNVDFSMLDISDFYLNNERRNKRSVDTPETVFINDKKTLMEYLHHKKAGLRKELEAIDKSDKTNRVDHLIEIGVLNTYIMEIEKELD